MMTHQFRIPAMAALLALVGTSAVHAADKPSANERGEAELAKLLEGRVAGEPKRCLSERQRRSMQIVDKTAFVFRDGDTLYVNRPDNARFLDDFDLPVFKLHGTDLCRMDWVEMRSRPGGIGGAPLVLGDFVPYRKGTKPSAPPIAEDAAAEGV